MPLLVTSSVTLSYSHCFSVTRVAKEIITPAFQDAFSSCLTTTSCPFMGDWDRGRPSSRAEHTYQTPGLVSELCSPWTMTSRRKAEGGWGPQSHRNGHSCSTQLCLTAPWPASRCHSKSRRARDLCGVSTVVLKSNSHVLSRTAGASLLHHLQMKRMHSINTQWHLYAETGWKKDRRPLPCPLPCMESANPPSQSISALSGPSWPVQWYHWLPKYYY